MTANLDVSKMSFVLQLFVMRDFHSIPWDFHTRSSFCNSTRLSPVRSGHTWSFVFPADVSIFILDIVLSLLLLFFFFFGVIGFALCFRWPQKIAQFLVQLASAVWRGPRDKGSKGRVLVECLVWLRARQQQR